MKRKIMGLLLAILCLSVSSSLANQETRIFADGAQLEIVSRDGIGFNEGVVAAKDGKIYTLGVTWLNESIKNGVIYCFDPVTGKTSEYMKPSGSALGLHIDKNNDLIIASSDTRGGPQGIRRHNLTTGETEVITDEYKGKHYVAPNDVTSDAKGRIYFTDARYGGKTLPWELPNAVYRIDTDGTVTQISTDIFRPNGIEVSPDGKHLYVAAANEKRLLANPLGPLKDKFNIEHGGVVAYDLDENGKISNGHAIFKHEHYNVDGMAMDTDGNLYLAIHNGKTPPVPGEIIVLNPIKEKVIAKLIPPEGTRPSNVGFGRGDDANSLYITTGLGMPWKLLRIKTLHRGFYQE